MTTSHAPAPFPGGPPLPPPPWPPAPPPRPARRWSTLTVVLTAVASAVVAGVVAGGATLIVSRSDEDRSASPPNPTALPAPPPPSVTAEEAQDQVCAVLRGGYETVAHDIDVRNTFKVNDWTDPAVLGAANNLVSSTSSLADKLQHALSPAAPDRFANTVNSYIAGLRALAISEQNHAPASQLNGVGDFYNQVMDAPLRLCGIPH